VRPTKQPNPTPASENNLLFILTSLITSILENQIRFPSSPQQSTLQKLFSQRQASPPQLSSVSGVGFAVTMRTAKVKVSARRLRAKCIRENTLFGSLLTSGDDFEYVLMMDLLGFFLDDLNAQFRGFYIHRNKL
jgi:hypothetical protein